MHEVNPGGSEYSSQIFECLRSLLDDAARDQVAGFRVEPYLARGEEHVPNTYSLGVGAESVRSVLGGNRSFGLRHERL